MMGMVMPETCWAYKKYNKIISGICLVCLFFSWNKYLRDNLEFPICISVLALLKDFNHTFVIFWYEHGNRLIRYFT